MNRLSSGHSSTRQTIILKRMPWLKDRTKHRSSDSKSVGYDTCTTEESTYRRKWEHTVARSSPHIVLTGHHESIFNDLCCPECERKKTSLQEFFCDVMKRWQEPNDLCRRNTQQAQIRRSEDSIENPM